MKTLTGLPGMKEGEEVIIWRMNNGFKSDFQGACSEVSLQQDPTNPKKPPRPIITLSPAKMRLQMLIYGIWEAKSYGITVPRNHKLELAADELSQRTMVVRSEMDEQLADKIYEELLELNKAVVDQEELEKKSDSQ